MTIESTPITTTDSGGRPRYGLHVGALAPIDLRTLPDPIHQGAVWRATHHKRWLFTVLTSDPYVVVVAMVQLGYASTAFAYVLDRRTRSMLFNRSYLGLGLSCRVSDGCEEGCEARFRSPRSAMSMTRARGANVYTLEAQAHELSLRASFDASCSPSPISVIAPVQHGSIFITEKRVLMPVRGQVLIGDRFTRLDGAVAGFDYTQGFLARRTAWRWAFCMGQTTDGRPIGLNLVEGFNGSHECVVWVDDQVFPVAEPRFVFERDRPLAPWKISTADGAIDLRFKADAVHAERKNLGVIRADFIQPVGCFSGSIELPGHRSANLDCAPGVVEHQDVLW